MATQRSVRWGVMGTARIATTVGNAIKSAAGAELTAAASRSTERAARWAAEHGAARGCGGYQALLDDPDIDAVYIPLPPSMHAEWTIRAAERGKHILCEKPLAMSAVQAEEMAAACREHNVQLMDGVMWLHHPRAADMRQAIDDSAFGRLRRVTSAFTFNRDFPLDDLRMQRALGGGSLLDLGWYTVGVTLWAFGDMPTEVYGRGTYCNDVDLSFSGQMWFSDDRIASFDVAFNTSPRRWVEVAGSDRSLICDDFTRPWDQNKPRFWIHGESGKADEHQSASPIQEVCMIKNFCRIVRSGTLDPWWPASAIAAQRVCDALDKSARSHHPCAV